MGARVVAINDVEITLVNMGISVRRNLLSNETEIVGLPPPYSKENAVNTLPVILMEMLKKPGLSGVTSERINGILSCIADKNRFNPIEIWLNSGVWDGIYRIPELFEILNITENKHKMYIVKWLVQCVALGLNDNENPVNAEGVLVLQGPQGLAKTSFFRKLMPTPRFFVEGAAIDVANKDSLLNALSGWVCELGELDSTLKREQSALKAFITAPSDKIRHPYAKNATRTSRRTPFCGMVNPEDYLRDETGSRRFWTVPVTHIDKNRLFGLKEEWVTQLWFEVFALYKTDTNGFRLTDVEMAMLQLDNQKFSLPLPYEIEIRELLDFTLQMHEWRWWKASEILAKAHCHASAAQVGKVLTKIVSEESSSGRWGINAATGINISPAPAPAMKTANGYKLYFLPIKFTVVL